MDIKDLMQAAHSDTPDEFRTAFNDIMADKLNDAIDVRADEVGSSIGTNDVGEAE